MGIYKYVVKPADFHNIRYNVQTMKDILAGGVNAEETILELDYSEVQHPIVSMSTGVTYETIIRTGIQQIVIAGHKDKERLLANPLVSALVDQSKVVIL